MYTDTRHPFLNVGSGRNKRREETERESLDFKIDCNAWLVGLVTNNNILLIFVVVKFHLYVAMGFNIR